MIKLTGTSSRYAVKDESGYEFEVVTQLDPEWGWSAHVTCSSSGMKTEEAAIDRALIAAKQFIRIMETP